LRAADENNLSGLVVDPSLALTDKEKPELAGFHSQGLQRSISSI
jgi:hypothetical protein